MDELLYKFYSGRLCIDATKADKHQLSVLEDLTGLTWASRVSFYKWFPMRRSHVFMYCGNDLYENEYGDRLDKDDIAYKLIYNKNYVYYSDVLRYISDKEVIQIQDFIDHFRREIKEVTDKEIEEIWN